MLTDEIGPANLMAALRKAGTAPEVPGGVAGLAVSLGGVGLSLTELVQLYAFDSARWQGATSAVAIG